MNKKVIIAIIIFAIIFSLGIFVIAKFNKKNMTDVVVDNSSSNFIQRYDITDEEIKKLPSTQIVEQTKEQEDNVAKEQEVESEEFNLQGKIAYEGASEYPEVSLGNYVGLTYYNQIDSRWRTHLYTSVGNTSQTIGSSGCGPTSAAMIVTAIRGTITPDRMGDLFVKYGYRSPDNGTYWSAFRWIADVFDIGYQETSNIDTAINLVRNNNYVVASVGNGLFTTGGHFVVIVGVDGNNLKIYDPYLYSGKFDTSTRRGKVTVSGNTVYCSIDNFRNYANYKNFFVYKHDEDVKENVGDVTVSSYVRYINTLSGIGVNVRNGPGTNYEKVGALADGTSITVYETVDQWSRIGSNEWVCSDYLISKSDDVNLLNTIGQTRKTKNCYLYSNSNLTGIKYTYKANTTVTILENVSSTVDKVKVNMTGRVAYIDLNSYKDSNYSSSVGKIKRFKAYTVMYSNSNLTGTKYQYLANTSVKVLQNISNAVDKVQVIQTGRIAFVSNNSYK